MRTTQQNSFSALNAVTGIAGILLGVIVGYIIGANQGGTMPDPVASAPAAAAPATAAPAAGVLNEAELQAFKDILKNDPKNLQATVQLANRLYDAGRYVEAIPYYQRALTLDPKNVNVSTDLATALYYTGRIDESLAQMEKSLAIDPSHGQTLFNIGIIRRDGKKDPTGAVESWQRLLQVDPDYPEAARVRALIAETKT